MNQAIKKTHVIIGGGAAGIFSAICCKEQCPSSSVIVLEKTNQLLSKVRISGGGRCNVTHACFVASKLISYYPRGSKELLGPFHHFQPKDTVAWFEKRSVLLKTEDDGRMFPDTDSSTTIIDCLLEEARRIGVDIRKQQRVLSIQKKGNDFLVQLEHDVIMAQHILLATGSSSWGHDIAKQFGHEIITPVPSLFTFNTPTSNLLDLSGISIPDAIVTIKETGQSQQGPLLLTHWGFSGPAVLKLSAWAARELYAMNYKATLLVNWTAAQNHEALYHTLLQQKNEYPRRKLPQLLPGNLFARLLTSIDMHPSTLIGTCSDKTLLQLSKKLYSDAYVIDGKTTYKQEFVTAGGVSLKEVDFKTMQSRLVPGLFFAGEILNIDGITGGFNFQNAWTTGYLAGTAMSLKNS